MSRNHTSQRVGFTLVELLVVVGIIALLISFLLPALNRARRQAVKTQCMSNLRSFGLGYMNYATEFKGIVPGRGLSPSWTRMEGLIRYFTDTKRVPSTQYAKLRAAEIVKCPACPNIADDWTVTLTYGAFNWVFLTTTKDSANVVFAGDTYADVEGTSNGSTTYLFPEIIATNKPPQVWFGHDMQANLLMADGHVESFRREQLPVANDVGAIRAPGYKKFWLGLKWKP